jgi:hypothetical protein
MTGSAAGGEAETIVMSSVDSGGPPQQGVIRITPEDLAAPHVDDLLKRQASLRGERGITADRRRKWYYRNWFIFMIAGLLGAGMAWAALEPHFNDFIYLQGPIQEINLLPAPSRTLDIGWGVTFEFDADIDVRVLGDVRIQGSRVVLLTATKPYGQGASPKDRFQPESLKVGQELGVYVEALTLPQGPPLALALFVDSAPPAAGRTTRPLHEAAALNLIAALALFPVVAACVGLGIGAADGLVCRLWRRVLLAGAVGLAVGLLGGLLATVLAGLIYTPLNQLAMKQHAGTLGQLTTWGFLTQMSGRGLAWCVAGMAMGLGQGIALRSRRLLLYGFLGGAIGGLLGGLLFDPIDMLLLGRDSPSAHVSRVIGIVVIGAVVGMMIGVVELLARDAWLHMVRGPLAGKEFLIFKDQVQMGASPRSDIYLFNDEEVAPRHAVIRATADHYEIEATDPAYPVLLNGRPVQRARMRHGDLITLGETEFAFQRRRTE